MTLRFDYEPEAIRLLRRLAGASQTILETDSPDHTLAPTDEQWGELDNAADEASAFIERYEKDRNPLSVHTRDCIKHMYRITNRATASRSCICGAGAKP